MKQLSIFAAMLMLVAVAIGCAGAEDGDGGDENGGTSATGDNGNGNGNGDGGDGGGNGGSASAETFAGTWSMDMEPLMEQARTEMAAQGMSEEEINQLLEMGATETNLTINADLSWQVDNITVASGDSTWVKGTGEVIDGKLSMTATERSEGELTEDDKLPQVMEASDDGQSLSITMQGVTMTFNKS